MPLRQLQGMDTSFVALETPNSPMHIGSILLFDPSTAPGGFVRFKDILQYFESRLQLSSMVRQRLVRVPFDLDYPYWVEDENFDLEFHIRHIALPKPGDWRQLCIQTARIFARPLDLTRPPWEFTVVEGLDNVPNVPPGSFAIVSKVHHAAIDGMSGIDLMEALYTLDPNTPPPNAPDEWKPEKVPSNAEACRAGAIIPTRCWSWRRSACSAITGRSSGMSATCRAPASCWRGAGSTRCEIRWSGSASPPRPRRRSTDSSRARRARTSRSAPR